MNPVIISIWLLQGRGDCAGRQIECEAISLARAGTEFEHIWMG